MNDLKLLIILFAVLVLISTFYWQVAHPVIVRRITYRLFARRDKLRNMAISGHISSESPDYQELESVICKTINFSSKLNLVTFIWYSAFHANKINESSDSEVIEASCSDIESFRHETINDTFLLMGLNSPFLCSVGLTAVLLFWLMGRFNSLAYQRRAESFVGALPDSRPGLRLA